jgi:hypothetical protein
LSVSFSLLLTSSDRLARVHSGRHRQGAALPRLRSGPSVPRCRPRRRRRCCCCCCCCVCRAGQKHGSV